MIIILSVLCGFLLALVLASRLEAREHRREAAAWRALCDEQLKTLELAADKLEKLTISRRWSSKKRRTWN